LLVCGLPGVEDEEDRSDEAEGGSCVVPAQVLTEVEGDKDAEDDQGDDFLNDFELDGREPICAEAVSRYLKAVLEEGNAPTDEDDLPEGFLAKAKMAVPGEGHEDVGEDEKNDCPH